MKFEGLNQISAAFTIRVSEHLICVNGFRLDLLICLHLDFTP